LPWTIVIGSSHTGRSGHRRGGELVEKEPAPTVTGLDPERLFAAAPEPLFVAATTASSSRTTRLPPSSAAIPSRAEPEWNDRIEVDYVSARGLAECRTRTTTIARISPGGPLHLVEGARDFMLDWCPARSVGMTLVGPPITSLIPPIRESEYLEEVRKYLADFRTRFDHDASARSQAYAIFTMCRGFYSIAKREQLSKREAALRARRDSRTASS
jgi:hypothetical protein